MEPTSTFYQHIVPGLTHINILFILLHWHPACLPSGDPKGLLSFLSSIWSSSGTHWYDPDMISVARMNRDPEYKRWAAQIPASYGRPLQPLWSINTPDDLLGVSSILTSHLQPVSPVLHQHPNQNVLERFNINKWSISQDPFPFKNIMLVGDNLNTSSLALVDGFVPVALYVGPAALIHLISILSPFLFLSPLASCLAWLSSDSH